MVSHVALIRNSSPTNVTDVFFAVVLRIDVFVQIEVVEETFATPFAKHFELFQMAFAMHLQVAFVGEHFVAQITRQFHQLVVAVQSFKMIVQHSLVFERFTARGTL